MGLHRFLTIILDLALLGTLVSCSRESPLKENVSLKNNHSRVYVSTTDFENPQAFLDSLANTPVNAADSLPDTITVTVNDTVYMMGVLPYNVDKIYQFQWNLTKKDGKDTVIIGDNAKPQAWAYAKAGVYYPLFIAIDGNNATDTAGTNTKQAYIKVIDTKPMLKVPTDTLWTRHKGNITFPITATDSFGTIEKILVDLDGNGKEKAKEWEYTKSEEKDNVYNLTIKNDSTHIDSLGNQMIYVIVMDDDGNETKDSVHLHFNIPPKLNIISPADDSHHYTSEETFFFYYKVTDVDNPKDIRYTIWAQRSQNGNPPSTAFTDDDLIVENYVLNMFEPRNENGENVITLLNNPSKKLDRRIFWEMLATDGYDTVWMDRIKTGTSTSRPWKFFIAEKNSNEAIFTGVAKHQGRTDHSGIQVEITDGNKTYYTTTDTKGNYTVTVDSSGNYNVTAKSSISKEFSSVTVKDQYIESGEETIPEITLKDTAAPVLLVDNLDTLRERTYDMTIYVRDLGTFIDTITATLNDEAQVISCGKVKGEPVANCKMSLTDLTDGVHSLVYTAKDNAGNKTAITQSIVVDATSMTLDVNGAQKDVISATESLVFTAQIINALPAAKSVTWTWEVQDGDKIVKKSKKTDVDETGKATFTLTLDSISTAQADMDYLMTASYDENNVSLSSQVKYGVLGINPAIMFTEPGFETSVTINDPISFKVKTVRGQGGNDVQISWNCGTNISTGYTCPTTEDAATLAFSKVGTYKVVAIVTDKDDATKKGTDTVTVNVIKDPPSVKAFTESKEKQKIHAKVNVTVNASDKFGTVNKIKWNCYNAQKGVTPILGADQEKQIETPAASISETVSITLPGEETNSYTCYFKAIDDDGEENTDTLVFATLLDPPTVVLATHTETVKINAVVPIKAKAEDGLGYIAEYNVACSENEKDLTNPEWTQMPGPETSVKMPSSATDAYHCVVMVKDDDGNEARDKATYKVVVGRPTVTAMLPEAYEVVTIKDTIEVNAFAKDSLGTLVKYEWGCGPDGSTNIGFNVSGTSSYAKLVMPSTEQSKYLCIIRVTDDDGNSAKDTVSLKVILAPPSIEVDNESLTIREGYNIKLGATATDNNGVTSDPGFIAKREWSCGTPDQIAKNWKTVSAYDTVWKAPAPEAYYYCVARATDNDGNVATDTMSLKFSTDLPKIWVKDELIYINVGDNISLNATVNEVWQGINWFTWECVSKKDGKSLESKVTKYDYTKNNKSFAVTKDSSYSEKGTDMYCIVSAEEASTKATFSDTTEVRIMEQHPEGVITAADTAYLWSGDELVNDEAIYFYSKEWGGMNSKLGELGDKNNQKFNWRFSNIKNSSSYYQGNKDGTIDTSIAEFNSAFIRRQTEGSVIFYLDYYDSTMNPATYSFLARHHAEEVSRKIYFRKAWENLSKDTVVDKTTMNTAPAMIMVNNKPTIAYLTSKNTLKAAIFKDGSWSSIATLTTTDSITTIKLATDGTDLYVGVLEASGSFSVRKSAKASSDFATVGTAIANAVSPQLLLNPSSKVPVAVYINKTDKQNYVSALNGSNWSNKKVADFKEGDRDMKFREVNAAFTSSGMLMVVSIDTTTDFKATSTLLNSTYNKQSQNKNFASNVSGMSLATTGSTIYMGFLNRDVNKYGPYVYKATISGNNINWNMSDAAYAKPIFEGYIAFHINVIASGDRVYASIDDKGKPNLAQVHVFKLENSKWHFYGENQLPYFNGNFYTTHAYNLRGSSPNLAIDNDGKVFVSMLGRATKTDSNNNGPIVMKYVADNWEIH